MSLLDRLRPKWQSADADVRADAVRELSRDEVELITAVAQQDADPKVRRIAIKKLDSPRLLLEIAEKDDDARVRDFAKRRACQILVQIACDDRDLEESRRALELLDQPGDRIAVHERARFPELRSAALASFTGESELFELVKRAKDPEVRARALARIESPLLLKKVVFDEAAGDLALSAVSRIEDLPALESIYEQPSLGNAVRRHAFSKLEKLVPHDHPIKVAARQERYHDVCVRAESLADARSFEEATGLRADWAALESEGAPDPQLLERFRNALERLDAIAAAARRTAETKAPPADPGAPAVEGPPLAATVESLAPPDRDGIEQARAEADETAAEALRAEGASILERAERAIEDDDLAAAASRFRDAARDWKRLERAPRPPSTDLADLAERFRGAEEKLKQREDALRREREDALQATLRDLEGRIERMDGLSALSEVPIKDAERELREAQELLKSMGPLPAGVNRRKARSRLTEARRKLFQRTQETRTLDEWKRWANVDVQKHLIERIEALRASNDVPRIAKEIRAIHEEWKKAGAATADQADELWTRYKSVRDELKARCDEFFKRQAGERKENLKKKEELCEQVEALKDSQDWNATADAIKVLQQQWKKLGPVPRASSDAIWGRFRAACDHFFDRRKQVLDRARSERDENLAKKIALCERAESLRESTSWQETVEELKKLQSQWREIGAVPRKISDEVWNRFRAACDHFFERYKRRDEVDLQERKKRRGELVAEAEALAAVSEASSEAASRVNEIWEEWKKLGPPGREDRDRSERLEQAVASVVLRNPESFSGGDLDPRASRKKRQKLCERLESVVEELGPGHGSPAPLEDLAQRLKDALASNTMTGGKRPPSRVDWRGASDEVARIRNTWLRTAPVPGDEGLALAERFHKALRSFDEIARPEEAASRTGS
jgi:hypothetical protein